MIAVDAASFLLPSSDAASAAIKPRINEEKTMSFDPKVITEDETGRAKENAAPAGEQTKHKYWLWIAGGVLALVAISNCSANQPHYTKNQTHYTKGEPYYTSRDGNRIAIPGQSSAGATAVCRNGSFSYSENHRGTCSQEGGVAEWLLPTMTREQFEAERAQLPPFVHGPYVNDPELLDRLNRR
jgi:uncharacterized protein DUF3761